MKLEDESVIDMIVREIDDGKLNPDEVDSVVESLTNSFSKHLSSEKSGKVSNIFIICCIAHFLSNILFKSTGKTAELNDSKDIQSEMKIAKTLTTEMYTATITFLENMILEKYGVHSPEEKGFLH